MSPELFSRLEELATARTVHAPGSHLFRKDAPVRSIFAVISGNVLVIRRGLEGDELVLQRAGARSVVSEASVHSRLYHCDAVAVEETTALSIRKTDLVNEITAEPEFGVLWLEHLSREVQRSRARAEMLAIRSLPGRLDAWMEFNGSLLPPKGNWHTLARELAVSPEALYRELARRKKLAAG